MLVNLARYGSVTAATELFAKFGRSPGPNALISLMSRPFYRDQIDRFATELAIGVWWPSTTSRLVEILVVASGVGLVRSVLRRQWPRDGWALLAWVLALAPIAMMLVASAVFISQGGYPHSRYALPGLGGLAILWAFGIECLPGARRPALAVGAISVMVVANATLFGDFLAHGDAWYAEALPAVDLPTLVPLPVPVIAALLLGVPALLEVIRALLTVDAEVPRRQPSSLLNSP